MSKVGDFIKSRRESLGKTQDQLAAATGNAVTVSSLSKSESGKTEPRRGTLTLLAPVLGVRLASLLDLKSGKVDSIRAEDLFDPTSVNGNSVGSLSRAVPEQFRSHPLRFAPVINRTPGGTATDHGDPYHGTGAADGYIPLTPDADPDKDLFYAQVVGESMVPYLRPGDWILCSPNSKRFVNGAMYCIQFDGSGDSKNCVKFVYEKGSTHYELRPANPRFSAEVIERGGGVGLSMVQGVFRSASEVMRQP